MIAKKNKLFIILFLSLLVLFSSVFCCFNIVHAQVKEDSGVIDDLSRDKNFNILNYPENIYDCSMNVIHLAESESGALYLYVYQPTGLKRILSAKSISLCTKDYEKYSITNNSVNDNSPLFIVYDLELVDYEKTLFKYKVVDYNYKKDLNFQTNGEFDKTLTRNYEISTIWRPFIDGVDTALDSEAIHTIKGLEVGKMFSIKTLSDGSNSVSVKVVEVISITDKFVGSMRLKGGWLFSSLDKDVYFVSFSTDKEVDELLEADVYYYYTSYKQYGYYGAEKQVQAKGSKIAELNIFDTCEWEGSGWSTPDYKYNRIYSIDGFNAFLKDNESAVLRSNLPDSMKTHEWVLCFAEFDYELMNSGTGHEKWTELKNVAILRLKFKTNGAVFNLGVVDDMSSPDSIPDIVIDNSKGCKINWRLILSMIALIILLILLAPVLPFILNFLLTLISLPFKLIGVIIKKIKKEGGSNGKKT